MAIVKSFGVTAALHRTQTHSGCQTLVVRSTVEAHSICRVGSSRQDVSSSGWSGLMRARRGQQMRIGCSGAGGLGVRVSGVVRVFGYRPWSLVCLPELFQSVLALLYPLLSACGARWMGLVGPHPAWRNGDASDGCKLASCMERLVRCHPGGCRANRLHMLWAVLLLLL